MSQYYNVEEKGTHAIQNERNRKLAECRVNKMRRLYSQDYKVTTYPVNANGVDMVAENRKEILAFQITNWNKTGRLGIKKLHDYLTAWKDFERELEINDDKRNRRRILVYNYPNNIVNVLQYLNEAGVELQKIGKQDLPTEDCQEESVEGWQD
jgi:hypothetical protein